MIRSHLLLVMVMWAIALAAGCSRSDLPPPGAGKESGKEASVKVGKLETKKLRRIIEQPASIDAYEETPLVARIMGYVGRVNADIGTLVKKDDILAELSVPEMLKEVIQKEALVAQAKAEVTQSESARQAADANVVTARAQVREAESARSRAEANYDRWKSELARVEKLVADKIVDKQIRDESLNQFRSAEASRNEVETRVQSALAMVKESEARASKAGADIEVARARMRVAQADEDRLKALAEYRFIRAPFKGVVTRRNVHTGYFLQPNPGSGMHVVFVVARTDLLRIHAEIPEVEAANITPGMTAEIRVPFLRDFVLDGKVARTSVSLDAKSRTLRVEIDYLNKDNRLRPGMYANLIFNVDRGERRVLPSSALFTHADQPCCWRVVDGKAVRTPVKLGIREGQLVEVLQMQTKSGDPAVWENVTGQEWIVLSGLGSVSEGKAVPLESPK